MTTLVTRGRAGLVVAGMAAVVLLSGCSEEKPGTPLPSGDSPTGGTSDSKVPTTSRSTNAAAGDVDPCELLPDAEAARLGLPTPGRSRKVAGNPACSWQASGQFSVIIGTDTKGLDGVTGQSVPLPKHKAIQSVDPGGFGGCGLFIETSAKSSVIVAVILSGGKPAEEACPRSTEVAKIVDSTLP